MRNNSIDALSKVNLMSSDALGDSLHILWMNAACHENKYTLNLKPHNHTFFEIHFVTSGSIVYRFDFGDVEVSDGHMIINTPNMIHCIPHQSDDFQKITVAFEVDEGSRLSDVLTSKGLRALRMDGDISESLAFITRRAVERTTYSEVLIKNRICDVIRMITEDAVSKSVAVLDNRSKNDSRDIRVLKAKKYIEDNPHIFLTCEEVALVCNLGTKQLGRLFLEQENISLLAFIHGQKIEEAKRMIANTDELSETVSRRLGFSSVNYFIKFFTKHTGLTPGEFRRRTRAGD